MEMERTTDRQERIPGFEQQAIRTLRVAVCGAGATGNEVLKCMALTGFGYVHVWDMDHISTSNLSRTVLFSAGDVGKKKAPLAAERFETMHIDGGKADYFDGDICHGLGEGVIRHCDLVIGCLDNQQTRLYVSHLCKLLQKPYIDLGIAGFDWNVFQTSGRVEDACFACMLSQRGEDAALERIRNSCDVTRRKAAAEGHIPTIGISSAAAGAFAVQEAIKVAHQLRKPDSGLPAPQFGVFTRFTAADNELRTIHIPVRRSCSHHDTYEAHGGVRETPMSARWTLRRALQWVGQNYGGRWTMALYKDCAVSDRSFVTRGFCEHCGKPIAVYQPQPLEDEDLLCEDCKQKHLAPVALSGAELRSEFGMEDEDRLLDMTLLELGVPLLHIVEFAPAHTLGESLFLELTGDLHEVMPNLPD